MRLAILVISGVLALPPVFAASCDDLAKVSLPDATISSAVVVPAGGFTLPGGPPVPLLPEFCRVSLVLKPAADSHIEAEVWLPAAGWNGKFQFTGNGGYAGVISYGNMAVLVARGYATAGTDTGHKAAVTDAAWALNHPDKIVDFGYRAVHETTVKAKALIKALYGEAPKRSYFSSCSNGGRQALMEVQRYPADYDGVIAGAPANDWTHLFSAAIWFTQALTLDPAGFIPPRKLPAVQAAALAACDNQDGVKDGVIENPAECHFDPSPLLCKGEDSDKCLTAPQITALKKIYAGPRTAHGKQIAPGYSPGGEGGQASWGAWITGAEPLQSLMFAFGNNFFRNMLYSNAAWDYKTFSVDRDPMVADEKLSGILSATETDLKKFKDRGGKLILFHGWCDAAIPAQSTVNYYERVIKKMGAKSADSFVRLYMVPGMQHCGGGDGPSLFGQNGMGQGDALHNMEKSMERWVEEGAAPKQIIATKFKAGSNPPVAVRTRPLCPYPQTAHWNGSGSTDDDANFVCK